MPVPPTWFTAVAQVEEPRRQELLDFVDAVVVFLDFVIEHPNTFGFLWQDREDLRLMARETFRGDVVEIGRPELRRAIPEISDASLRSHGLSGRALRFKLNVLDSITARLVAIK